jgi:hypothetical protein
MAADASLDLLLDLKHDLGKYLVLPFALLPKEAAPAAVHEALARALRETRRGPRGVQTAVDRALAWEQALDAPAPLDRAAVERDLRAVQEAISALIAEVQDG